MLSAITGRQTCCHTYPQLKSVDSTDENIARNGSSDRNRHRGEHVFARREDSIRRAPTKTTSPQYRPRPINLSRRPTSGDDDAEAAATTAAAPASPVAVPAFWPKSNSSTDRMPVAAGGVCSSTASGCKCDSPRRWSLFCFTAVSASSSSSSPKCTPSHAVEIQGREENEQEHHHHRHNSHCYLQMKHPHRGQQEHNRPAAAQDFDIPNREDASTAAASAAAERRGRGDFVNENAGNKEEDEAGWSDSSSQASNENIHSEPQPAVDTITTAAAETKKWARKFPFGIKLGSLWRKRRREGTALVFINQGSTSAPSEFQLRSPAAPASTTTTTEKGNFRSAIQSSFGGRRQFAKAQRGSVVGKIAMVTALACSSVFQNAQALFGTKLSFDPPEAGYPTEITFTFTPNYTISEGKFIRLYMAGFTRGERDGTAGADLGFNNEDDTGNEALAWPSDTFRGWWSEGTPEEQFEDSIFNLYALQELDPGVSYTAIIDRSSGIKSNCGHPQDFSAFHAWVDDETTFYKMFGKVDYDIEEIDEIPMSCYMALTSLKCNPPLPRTQTHITVGFQPARSLIAGDNVTVNLKGFTSGDGNGTLGADFEVGELLLANGSAWLASWEEGTYVEGKPGYEGSMLQLEALAPIPAGVLHEVTVYRSNGILAQCGMPENDTSPTISVVSASDPPWNATGRFTFTQTVGTGCRDLNYCSTRGECDYCLQRCNCLEGFGSLSDLEDVPEIARDCSQATCPFGISWTPVLSGHPRPDPDASHTMAECSNMGTCIRAFGICLCETGFEGRACERYACPNMCSGNGACRNMRELGLMRTAEPLVNATTAVSGADDATEGFEVAYGWDSPEGTATWESRSMFGCVCDSSWEVGLGQAQTQQAEYFGPDCSLLHCPTGDDPETDIDETDCQNITADGGRGVGSAGNLCHVDCSNRGICDYETGVCSCFDGYHGQACHQKQIDGYGFNTDGS